MDFYIQLISHFRFLVEEKEKDKRPKKFEKMRSRPLMKHIPKLKKHHQSQPCLPITGRVGQNRIFSKFGGKKGGMVGSLVNKNREILGRVREISYLYYDYEHACLFLFHWVNPQNGEFFLCHFPSFFFLTHFHLRLVFCSVSTFDE